VFHPSRRRFAPPYTKVGMRFYLRLEIEKTLSSAVVGDAGGQLRMRSVVGNLTGLIRSVSRNRSTRHLLHTSRRRGSSHSKCKLISIKIDDIKVAHAIVVILWWLDYVGSARGQFGVDTIDVPHEHADAAIAG